VEERREAVEFLSLYVRGEIEEGQLQDWVGKLHLDSIRQLPEVLDLDCADYQRIGFREEHLIRLLQSFLLGQSPIDLLGTRVRRLSQLFSAPSYRSSSSYRSRLSDALSLLTLVLDPHAPLVPERMAGYLQPVLEALERRRPAPFSSVLKRILWDLGGFHFTTLTPLEIHGQRSSGTGHTVITNPATGNPVTGNPAIGNPVGGEPENAGPGNGEPRKPGSRKGDPAKGNRRDGSGRTPSEEPEEVFPWTDLALLYGPPGGSRARGGSGGCARGGGAGEEADDLEDPEDHHLAPVWFIPLSVTTRHFYREGLPAWLDADEAEAPWMRTENCKIRRLTERHPWLAADRYRPAYLIDPRGFAEIVLDIGHLSRQELTFAIRVFALENGATTASLDGEPVELYPTAC
jgi:hypothetical protein